MALTHFRAVMVMTNFPAARGADQLTGGAGIDTVIYTGADAGCHG